MRDHFHSGTISPAAAAHRIYENKITLWDTDAVYGVLDYSPCNQFVKTKDTYYIISNISAYFLYYHPDLEMNVNDGQNVRDDLGHVFHTNDKLNSL